MWRAYVDTEVLLDSGAVAHVCPEGWAPGCGTLSAAEADLGLRAANGAATTHYRARHVYMRIRGPTGAAAVTFLECAVWRPILSIAQLSHAGRQATFSTADGELMVCDGARVPLERQGALRVPVLKRLGPCGHAFSAKGSVEMRIAPVMGASSATSSARASPSTGRAAAGDDEAEMVERYARNAAAATQVGDDLVDVHRVARPQRWAEESGHAVTYKRPQTTSAEEVATRRLIHTPAAAWRSACVAGRGKALPRAMQTASSRQWFRPSRWTPPLRHRSFRGMAARARSPQGDDTKRWRASAAGGRQRRARRGDRRRPHGSRRGAGVAPRIAW